MEYLDIYKEKLSDLKLIFNTNLELAQQFGCSLRTVTSLYNNPKLNRVLLRAEKIDEVHKANIQEIKLKKSRLNNQA